MGSVLAFGNPIIDYVVRVQSHDLLQKWNLDEDGTKEASEDIMLAIMQELHARQLEATRRPGGSALNTMRILQWLQKGSHPISFCGAIGSDENGELLLDLVKAAGIDARLAKIENGKTACAISITYRSSRSLIAHIGAAEMYSKVHFATSPSHLMMQNCDIVYMEAFFLTKRQEVARFVLQETRARKKEFVFNLGAEYVMDLCPTEMIHFAEQANVLMGNRLEFDKLANVMRLTEDSLVEQLTVADHTKMIVITNAEKPVRYHRFNESKVVAVRQMLPEQIVDTTRSGDAFVSGFLYGYLHRQPILRCIKFAIWTAQMIITQLGCVPPNGLSPDFINSEHECYEL